MTTQFRSNSSHVVLLIILGFAVLACYFLIKPYLNPVIIAFILALIFHPLHQWIEIKLKKRPDLAAFTSCSVLTFIILLPMLFMLMSILRQGAIYTSDLIDWINTGGLDTLMSHPWVSNTTLQFKDWFPSDTLKFQSINQHLMDVASSLGKNIFNLGAKLAGDITGFVTSFLLMLLVLFFVLRDFDKIFSFVRHALPLSRSQEDALLAEILRISKSALLGSFLTAITQGIAGGFALWLAGFPGLFWGTMMAFASLIPVVGTALIWLPTAIYLILTDSWGWGLFVISWGVLVVGSIDNFLRPLFMQGSSSMNTIIVFFALLGGIHAFGLMGLLYGPIIFAVTLVLFGLYETEFKEFLDYQDRH